LWDASSSLSTERGAALLLACIAAFSGWLGLQLSLAGLVCSFFGWLGLLVIELAITLWCKFTMHYAKCVETLADVEGTKV
jgi:hypothetical protein